MSPGSLCLSVLSSVPPTHQRKEEKHLHRLNLSRCFSLLSVFSLKPQTPQNRAKLVSPRCNQSGFLSCAQLNGCPKVYIASFVMFWKAMGMAAEQGSLDSSQP